VRHVTPRSQVCRLVWPTDWQSVLQFTL
jgi:hypothetical protein